MPTDNSFVIPVTHKSEDISFRAELVQFGYSYKIVVDVYGKMFSFERDEEHNFRGIVNTDDLHNLNEVDKVLLQDIATALSGLFDE